MSHLSRRSLIQGAASLATLSLLGSERSHARAVDSPPKLGNGAVILFQGDSITDSGRLKSDAEPNSERALGKGYAQMLAGEILHSHPDLGLKIFNRGISGNKVPDLAARWQADTIDLKPNVLSILIGVNDLWHTFAFGNKFKGTVKDYEDGYRSLLERTLKECPGVRIVICEPFTTRTSPEFKPLADYAAVSKKLAAEMKLTFVPFQSVFDQAVKAAPAPFWLGDGIHPTMAGYALMSRAWREAVGI